MITERIIGALSSLWVGLFILFTNSGPNTIPVTLALELDKSIVFKFQLGHLRIV